MSTIQFLAFNFSDRIATCDMERDLHLVRMATLDMFELATIIYCLENGMSKTLLARRFGKSRSWMYSLTKRDLRTVFPNEESRVWFETGVKARQMLAELQENHSRSQNADTFVDVANALWEASRIKREAKKEQKWRRIQNLVQYRSIREEEEKGQPDEWEEEEKKDDDPVEGQPVSHLILANMMRNSTRKGSNNYRYTNETLKFAYILRSYSAVCYDYLRSALPLPSRQLLSSKYRIVERELEASYENYESLDTLLLSYFGRSPLSSESERFQCSLSIDAFSIAFFEKDKSNNIPEQTTDRMSESLTGKIEAQVSQFIDDGVIEDSEEECQNSTEVGSQEAPQGSDSGSREGCNNVFLIVLNPFRWELPSVVLTALPWRSGHADSQIVTIILNIVEKLRVFYNIDVRVIGSDGDSGYNCLHQALYDVWSKKRKKDFFAIFNMIAAKASVPVKVGDLHYQLRAFPVADPLHACKVARARFLDHAIYLTPSVSLYSEKYTWLANEKWFTDRSQLARMSDFYALSMFSARTIITCCEKREYELAIYLWPWAALMAVIRVPFLTLDCRMSLLHSSFMLFQFFLNQMVDGVFTATNIRLRYQAGCEGVTFFDKSYLTRVMHLVLALYEEMVNGGYKLRLACFGSHINENIIGRIRVSCHGNPAFTVVKRVLAKAEVRRVMQAELGIEHNVRGRDNLGAPN